MRRVKQTKRVYKKECGAYFTVEAALVMPVVLACYLLIIMLLIYIYERCIWEQNAYRLLIWKEYVEGFINMNPAAEEICEEDIYRYILTNLNKEEAEKYFFGLEISAQINSRGDLVKVNRKVLYPQFGGRSYEMTLSCACLKPTEYVRMVTLLKEQIKERWEEND